ncbi:hypothetical protein EDD21DRAFT_361067 [Dissophora ornata]|nr:hypothetical protein EDD21DRAFT_361067 [Dissophora ornata]
MPAAATAKDLRKILKRAQKMDTVSALSALGPDWEIQSAKPDEWFRWEFPVDKNDVDRINIRMAVFDPNDHSERKRKTMKWLDNINEVSDNKGERERDWEDLEGELDEEKRGMAVMSTRKASSGHFEIRNGSESISVENLSIEHDNDHFLIQIEDDGAKLLNQKVGKMYLELAKIVDQAAVEMEAAEPGLDLGEQVVLVHKDKRDSFWNKFSLVGDVALRLPFNRTWIHDVVDE